MNNQPTNIQALITLFNATRLAPLRAEEHEALLTLTKQLEDFLTPKEEPKKK